MGNHSGDAVPSGNGERDAADRPDLLLAGLGLVILCFVWRIQDLFPVLGALQIPILTMVVVAGIYFFDSDPRRRLRHINRRLIWIIAGLGVLIVVGIPFALISGQAFTVFKVDYIPHAVMLSALTAAAVRSEEDVRWLAAIHVLGGVLFCVMALTRFPAGPSGRMGGLVYYDANDLALMLVTTFSFALFFLLKGRTALSRILAALAMIVYIITLVQTGSRGGFIGFCIVGAWILVRYQGIPLGRRLATLGAAVVLLAFVGTDDFWSRMETLLHPQQDYNWAGNAESGRMEIWKRGVGYMLERPFLGVGARNFNVAEGTLSEQGQLNRLGGPGFRWAAPHNTFIQVGAELGVFGLLLYLALFFEGFRIAGRSPPGLEGRRREDSLALRQAIRVALVGFAVTAFFLTSAYKPIIFALVGLLAAMDKLDDFREQAPTIRRNVSMVRLRRREPTTSPPAS